MQRWFWSKRKTLPLTCALITLPDSTKTNCFEQVYGNEKENASLKKQTRPLNFLDSRQKGELKRHLTGIHMYMFFW